MLVAQNVLVADDLPHTGWGVPAGYTPDPEPQPVREQPQDSIDCSEPYCDEYAVVDGPNLYRCPRGHLTVAQTPEEDPA